MTNRRRDERSDHLRWATAYGKIRLRNAAVGTVQGAVRQAQNDLHARVLRRACELHEKLSATPGTPAEPVAGDRREDESAYRDRIVTGAAMRVLGERGSDLPPSREEVASVVPEATEETMTFKVLNEDGQSAATITFEGRHVIWERPANRDHQVMAAPVARELFAALDAVKWRLCSGGIIWGHDEHAFEDCEHPYAIKRYGRGCFGLGITARKHVLREL